MMVRGYNSGMLSNLAIYAPIASMVVGAFLLSNTGATGFSKDEAGPIILQTTKFTSKFGVTSKNGIHRLELLSYRSGKFWHNSRGYSSFRKGDIEFSGKMKLTIKTSLKIRKRKDTNRNLILEGYSWHKLTHASNLRNEVGLLIKPSVDKCGVSTKALFIDPDDSKKLAKGKNYVWHFDYIFCDGDLPRFKYVTCTHEEQL